MKTAKIKILNYQKFLDDLENTTRIKVHAAQTGFYFDITKKELLCAAETKSIDYFMSENLDSSGYTMVVL